MMADSRIEQLERELLELRRQLSHFEAASAASAPLDEVLERALKDRVVLENLPDYVCLLDRHQTVLYLNRPVRGRALRDTLGLRGSDFVAEEHRGRFSETFEQAWTREEVLSLELETIRGFTFSSRFVPIRHAEHVVAMLLTGQDTTERVLAERALRQSEQRLRHAIEVAGMGTWSYDRRRDQLHWDDALYAIYGVPREPSARHYVDFVKLVHPHDRERVDGAFREVWGSRGYAEVEYRILRSSGEVRHLIAKGSATRDAQGEVTGALGVVFDITARKQLEEQVQQAQKMEAVGQLTAGIAHNFNDVLSVILPNVALCKADASPRSAQRLSDIELAAQRAAQLVRQLMLFARRDVDADKRLLDPIAIVRSTVEICRTTFDRSIQFVLELDDRAPAVLAHAGQLEQVLLNICINARDALESAQTAARRVTISVGQAADGGACICVGDNGPGMDAATLARVFEPFFTTKAVGHGTGLGMASAYAIVRDHGGSIECRSQPGAGARFKILLPGRPRAALVTATPAPAQRLRAQPSSETVLIVDDEPLVRRATRAMLEYGGFSIIECGDGAQALEVFVQARARIDLILLDRSMPGLSGEQVFMRLLELGCEAPVVLLSGQPSPSSTARYAAAVLSKPVQVSVLLDTLRSVLDRASSRASS
jgi:two-component system, cell cycle sensor histidine kinase and response regulator CckA